MHLRPLVTAIMAFACAAHASANTAIAIANLDARDAVAPTPTTPPVLYPSDPVRNSVLAVIITAIPRPILSQAINNSAAFSADLAASFSAGNTPPWFQALPADVKSLLPSLYPVLAANTSVPAPTPAFATSNASSAISMTASPTLGSTAATAPAASTATAAPAATGAAVRLEAVVGAGIVGAMGMLGMLVL